MYETFDHTADVGLRVRAADLNGLFVEAATGLFALIVEDPASVRETERRELTVVGSDLPYLLFDWLKTLLYHFDSEHWLLARCQVNVSESGLTAVAWGEPLDRDRHELGHEVKAITYHGLRVEQEGDGWVAEVIVDI